MRAQGLIDLGFQGAPFPWSNKRSGSAFIRECLDREIANGDWRLLFSRAFIKHFPRFASDHAALFLDTYGDQQGLPKPFRFEAFWLRNTSCRSIVANAWSYQGPGSPAFFLYKKIHALKLALRKWNRETLGLIQEQIRLLQSEISKV